MKKSCCFVVDVLQWSRWCPGVVCRRRLRRVQALNYAVLRTKAFHSHSISGSKTTRSCRKTQKPAASSTILHTPWTLRLVLWWVCCADMLVKFKRLGLHSAPTLFCKELLKYWFVLLFFLKAACELITFILHLLKAPNWNGASILI